MLLQGVSCYGIDRNQSTYGLQRSRQWRQEAKRERRRFDTTGDFRGTLKGTDSKPIVIDGLWMLVLGGGRNSSSDTLYFTAGPNGERDGLFGTITPVPK